MKKREEQRVERRRRRDHAEKTRECARVTNARDTHPVISSITLVLFNAFGSMSPTSLSLLPIPLAAPCPSSNFHSFLLSPPSLCMSHAFRLARLSAVHSCGRVLHSCQVRKRSSCTHVRSPNWKIARNVPRFLSLRSIHTRTFLSDMTLFLNLYGVSDP